MTDGCGFCGQDHEPVGEFLGFEIRPCPNMPDDWVAAIEDRGGMVIVTREDLRRAP